MSLKLLHNLAANAEIYCFTQLDKGHVFISCRGYRQHTSRLYNLHSNILLL